MFVFLSSRLPIVSVCGGGQLILSSRMENSSGFLDYPSVHEILEKVPLVAHVISVHSHTRFLSTLAVTTVHWCTCSDRAQVNFSYLHV